MNAFFFVAAAVLIEAIVTLIRTSLERYSDWKYLVSLVVGIILGILVSLAYDLDIFSLFGFEAKFPAIGAVLTGIIMARGSNYIADLLKLLKSRTIS